jgi:hypothetical protein
LRTTEYAGRGYATMLVEKHIESESSTVCYEQLEKWIRAKAQEHIQSVLEEEVTAFFGRVKGARRH